MELRGAMRIKTGHVKCLIYSRHSINDLPSMILWDNINPCEQKHSLESDVSGCEFGLFSGIVEYCINKTHDLSMPHSPYL